MLPLAIVVVLGQVAAFVAIKMSKSSAKSAEVTATAPVAGVAADAQPTLAVAPTDAATVATVDVPAPDAQAAVAPAVEPPTTEPPITEPTAIPDDKPKSRRELAKEKAAKDKADKIAREKADKAERAERADRERREADDRRRDAEAKRVADLEKARIAADAEKTRLAAETAKAQAAAEAAKLEAARLKAAQAAAATTTDTPKGSSSVLVLVLGPGVSNPGREAIRNVYLGKSSVWPNGTTAHPMNRTAGSAAGRKFYGGVLGMSSSKFREHWSEIQLSGGGIAPSTVSSATTMVARVAATRGGMGYVLESELPDNTSGVTLVRLK